MARANCFKIHALPIQAGWHDLDEGLRPYLPQAVSFGLTQSPQDPHPVLLMRVPYSKDHAQTVAFAHPYLYADRGHIVVVQDTRGRHKSEGFFEPWVKEAEDG